MPGLDAPGTSVPPLRRRVLRRVCRALRSRHPCLLRPLRLHSLTQVPSAGPTARWKPCGIVLLRCHSASAGVTVVSPLAGFPVRRLSRLSACRLDFSGHPASRLKPSRRLSVKARAIGLNRRLSVSGSARRVGRSGGWLEIFLHSSGTAAAPLSGFIVMK